MKTLDEWYETVTMKSAITGNSLERETALLEIEMLEKVGLPPTAQWYFNKAKDYWIHGTISSEELESLQSQYWELGRQPDYIDEFRKFGLFIRYLLYPEGSSAVLDELDYATSFFIGAYYREDVPLYEFYPKAIEQNLLDDKSSSITFLIESQKVLTKSLNLELRLMRKFGHIPDSLKKLKANLMADNREEMFLHVSDRDLRTINYYSKDGLTLLGSISTEELDKMIALKPPKLNMRRLESYANRIASRNNLGNSITISLEEKLFVILAEYTPYRGIMRIWNNGFIEASIVNTQKPGTSGWHVLNENVLVDTDNALKENASDFLGKWEMLISDES